MTSRCPNCGWELSNKRLVRICALCLKVIDHRHKYKTVQVSSDPPRFEFHHRHCTHPEDYVVKKKGKQRG